ncbi:DUF4381 domain-containing protein [Vibrio sonorensis]|uniref:DUF4381 domain-containing protein n=1 Tax=Vibrio sonorensis TaxID=1004316 RepID=UPI0008D8F8BC|nr:DUF4381 domain-containing protein [Vibrio sonorensis]
MSEQNTSGLLPILDIQLPELPSWLPLAWGWWASAGGVVVALLLVVFLIKRHKKKQAAKKTALRLLRSNEQPAGAIELVRQAALCYFPREQIAGLTGERWYAFLDDQYGEPLFQPNADSWHQVLYSKTKPHNGEELVEHCALWVEQALPPKRRRRRKVA